jgi:hypothetical protein
MSSWYVFLTSTGVFLESNRKECKCSLLQFYNLKLRSIFFCNFFFVLPNSCSWNTCVTWRGNEYGLSEDDMKVSKHVGSVIICELLVIVLLLVISTKLNKITNKRIHCNLQSQWETDSRGKNTATDNALKKTLQITASQDGKFRVRFPVVSLEIFECPHPSVHTQQQQHWGTLSRWQKWIPRSILGSKEQPARGADSSAVTVVPNVKARMEAVQIRPKSSDFSGRKKKSPARLPSERNKTVGPMS